MPCRVFSLFVRSILLLVVGSSTPPDSKADECHFFNHHESEMELKSGAPWKEVRRPEDLVGLSVVPTDRVCLIVTHRDDWKPLLTACAEAKLEHLTIWPPERENDGPKPPDLAFLLSEGKSSLRYLSVHQIKGKDGWEELPAEEFPDLEDLNIEGGNLTRISGKWFASLPKLAELSLRPKSVSDGTISALGASHLKTLYVDADDISCNAFRTWAGNQSLTYVRIDSLNADSADDVEILAKLTSLRSFRSGGDLSPCLPELYGRLPNLDSLFVSEDDEQTMRVLSKLPKLKHLELGGTLLTSEELLERLEILCEGADLESLILSSWQKLDDRGVTLIGNMRHLKSLSLSSEGITDASIDIVSELHDLECLSLYGCNVTSAGFSKLGSLQKLRRIDIRFTEILPDAIPTILKLKNLEEVVVTGPQWKSGDRTNLKALIPHLKINGQ